MIVKFALDTFRDVVNGDRDRRIHALLAFSLWFVAGAFLASTIQFYLFPAETAAASILGGVLASLTAAVIKVS